MFTKYPRFALAHPNFSSIWICYKMDTLSCTNKPITSDTISTRPVSIALACSFPITDHAIKTYHNRWYERADSLSTELNLTRRLNRALPRLYCIVHLICEPHQLAVESISLREILRITSATPALIKLAKVRHLICNRCQKVHYMNHVSI